MDLPLLTTKLFAPPPRPSLVPRPHLLARLDEALSPACRLALLSAPAGFGKTTLVSEWCESLAKRGVPLAWLTLDAEDNRPARLLHYLVAAVQRVYPEMGRSAQAVLDQPQALPVESVLTSLINELAGLTADFVLVLDDYHTLNGQAIHPVMAFLLEHHPPQMHLVILTRQDPLLPLARLRARGQLVELRAADLRFSAGEAAAFLKQALGAPAGVPGLSAGQIERLEAHTEGWVAGLQMAALSMRGRQDLDGFLAAFSGGHQFIFEYLTEEVLAQLEQPVRDFLYQTAFLDRLCAPLVDAVTGRADSQAMLNRIEQANLFLTALDDQGLWYRYHPLFADFLRRGNKPAHDQDDLEERRRRAARWFEANGLLQEAVAQALAAKDFEYAGRLIVQAGDAMFRSAIGGLLAWLEALPPQLVRASCELSTYQGWALLMNNHIDVSLACAEAAQAALTPATSAVSAWAPAGLAGLPGARAGQRRRVAGAGCPGASTLLGEAAPMFRSMLLTLMGQVYRQVGSTAEAEKSLRQALRIGERLGYNLGYYVAQANLAWILNIRGQRRQALAFSQQALSRCVDEGGRELPFSLFIYLPLAGIYYDGNQIAEARQCLERGFELCARLGFNPIVVGGARPCRACCTPRATCRPPWPSPARPRNWRRISTCRGSCAWPPPSRPPCCCGTGS